MISNEAKALDSLKKRINLCSRGITLPDDLPVLHLQSKQGGAGPQGSACYVGDAPGTHNSQISLVIYPQDHYLAKYALPTKWWDNNGGDEEGSGKKILCTNDNIFLEKVPSKWQGVLSNGQKTTRLSKARFHPYGTFSMCFYRGCRHIDNDDGCKYCTANLLIDKLNFPKKLPNELNLEYLKLAISKNPIRSVTLTSGTLEDPETTGKELLKLAKLIRQETNLSIHIQTEPIFDQDLLNELGQVADTIGIFLEFFNENIRKQICPGKSRAFTQDDYMESWEMAVSSFGWGKVFTTNIIGFDEDYEVILKGAERAAKIGVMTAILWLRVGSPLLGGDLTPSYLEREDETLQLHKEMGKILVNNSVDTMTPENAGCLGCHGCNATKEAILWARAYQKKLNL